MQKLIPSIAMLAFMSQAAVAQNLIQDGGFDGAPQNIFGNRWGVELPPWYFAIISPVTGTIQNPHNLVVVDGPGGFNYGNLGPESDASGAGAGVTQYYIDSGSPDQLAWQYFTPSCSGTATATVYVTNREDHGRTGETLFGDAVPSSSGPGYFFATEGGLSILPVTSQIPVFSAGFSVAPPAIDVMVRDLKTQHVAERLRFLLGAVPTQTSSWQPISHQLPVQAGQLYAMMVDLGHSVNMDNASVEVACDKEPPLPRAEAYKTCAPLVVTSNGSYQMNCQINVTGFDIDPGSYINVGDTFSGLLPVTATIAGPMMNVTSAEPWSCLDFQTNPPIAVGFCQLPGADLLAAGGQSTLNVSFDFTTDQASGQVANCPFAGIGATPISGPADLRNSPSMMKGAKIVPGLNLPAACVVLDLPPISNPPKVEDAAVIKTCDAPMPATVQGVQGYTWDCRADITVTPTPFTGSFVFNDDASNISIGAAQFLSASEPGCTGIGTDQLQCILNGNTMNAPHQISYQLFTEVTDPNKPIEWQNCVQGVAVSAEDKLQTERYCVETVIKPDAETNPNAEKVLLEKSCGRVFDTVRDGVAGMGWNCQIRVTAAPAPFAGSFTFTEDATGVSGSNNANIIAVFQQSNNWTCLPNTPTQSTQCTISGSDFDPSGVELIGFQLFAETGTQPIDWTNCASGTYTNGNGKPRHLRGNCESITWKPPVDPTPATFRLKKACKGPDPYENGQRYVCTISGAQTGGDPITSPLTLEELFSNTSGGPALAYLQMLQGSQGWTCAQPNFANGATCSIQPADFNGAGGHQITGFFHIPNSVLATQDFENCAALTMGDTTVASADCVGLDNPLASKKPRIDLVKACANAKKGLNGVWTTACTLTITGQNLPAGEQVSITDELMSSITQTANSGQMNAGTSLCSTGAIPNGIGSTCTITTDDINAAGGTLVIPFIGTYQGPGGRPMNGAQAQNCAFVDIPGLNLHGPTTPSGKSCVPVTFDISVIGGGRPLPGNPAPGRPLDGIAGAVPRPILDPPPLPMPELDIFKVQTSACVANRDRQNYTCGFGLTVTNRGIAPFDGPLVVTDTFGQAGVQKVALLSGNGMTCAGPMDGEITCQNPQLSIAAGGTYRIDLSMVVSGLRNGGAFSNCAAVGISDNPTQRVAAIQQALNARGLNAGTVDGKAGQNTFAALAQLQRSLGLPVSRTFDDALFDALGLHLQKPGEQSCITVDLPVMPAPPLQCDPATTVRNGESCLCRFDKMERSNATSCQCVGGLRFVKGKGCVVQPAPKPVPQPVPTPTPLPVPDAALKCDPASTRQRGDQCVCIDQKNAKKLSATQCGCTNGLPMINGVCIPIDIAPKPQGDGPAGAEKCLIMLNGICIK